MDAIAPHVRCENAHVRLGWPRHRAPAVHSATLLVSTLIWYVCRGRRLSTLAATAAGHSHSLATCRFEVVDGIVWYQIVSVISIVICKLFSVRLIYTRWKVEFGPRSSQSSRHSHFSVCGIPLPKNSHGQLLYIVFDRFLCHLKNSAASIVRYEDAD